RFSAGDTEVLLRAGRQELQLGKQRLLSPLDWANNRRIFDAVQLQLRGRDSRWTLTAFSAMAVMVRDGFFTWNDADRSLLFSGIYYTQQLAQSGHSLDAYAFAQNSIRHLPVEEDRYTIGAQAQGPIAAGL